MWHPSAPSGLKLTHLAQKYFPDALSPPMVVMSSKSSFDLSKGLWQNSCSVSDRQIILRPNQITSYPSKPYLAVLSPSSSAVVHVGPLQGLALPLVPSQ
jgi:hypothetical protein